MTGGWPRSGRGFDSSSRIAGAHAASLATRQPTAGRPRNSQEGATVAEATEQGSAALDPSEWVSCETWNLDQSIVCNPLMVEGACFEHALAGHSEASERA